MTGDGEQGPAGNLPRKCLLVRDMWGFLLGPTPDFGEQMPTSHLPELFYFVFPTLTVQLRLERTKAQPHLVSFLTLSACYTLCQVIFTPSKFEAAWCAVKNTIKLNYSGARNFPPPHLSSFLHLIPEQRKITPQSIRKGRKQKTSTAGVLDGTASEQSLRCPGFLPYSCISPSPSP